MAGQRFGRSLPSRSVAADDLSLGGLRERYGCLELPLRDERPDADPRDREEEQRAGSDRGPDDDAPTTLGTTGLARSMMLTGAPRP
ncbi:hypothetical protein [Agromyces subbeticus]|uniref:hypothetical protein n=1 Tax=Agromyces subbeticus TaxID=293890 RepID=UPI00146D231A|nr:hypothetical protein [Agromyces subbeticus]